MLFLEPGTAHLTVLAENGDAVSVTSTVNTVIYVYLLIFGTGILIPISLQPLVEDIRYFQLWILLGQII